jgi:hypothetical protein
MAFHPLNSSRNFLTNISLSPRRGRHRVHHSRAACLGEHPSQSCLCGGFQICGSARQRLFPAADISIQTHFSSSPLQVFLPILIFESGVNLEWHVVQRVAGEALTLAIPGTLLQTALIAITGKWILPYGWSWSECFLFASIAAAIDPVAVTALIKSVAASAKLGTIVEGESLLNDGVAFVLFEIFRVV